MALIKIINTGDKINFFIPQGYLPENDETIEVILAERTRNAAVLKITAPLTILITHVRNNRNSPD
ncbi:MAG: hypothetical protein KKF27_20325 [Gammaproteobacteria bacterium]|uniref:Uncharacterized protein n=1 Tax=viral metagenome TaxID=1070528 RepID=A0A6M3IE07_9ZZZZ|nr:hypothetical protein [Gammaproteobacteria bacterium]